MLKKLYIENYRGIHNLDLGELGQINIIAGDNNTGKTSLLEVIQSLRAPNDLRSWRLIGRREENIGYMVTSVYDTMKSLFPVNAEAEGDTIRYFGRKDEEEFCVKIEKQVSPVIITEKQLDEAQGFRGVSENLVGYDTGEFEADAMKIQYKVNGKQCGKDVIYSMQRGINEPRTDVVSIVENVVYISPTQHTRNSFFLDAILKNPELYEQFIDIMRQFDPYFVSINSIEEEGPHGRKYIVLSKNHKEGLLLNAYGDGMKKAMLLLSAVIRAKNGILLLDEFETAIHISAMENVFKWILQTAVQLHVQIFMTSHSIEAIEKVLKCCPKLQENIRMLTLVKVNDELKVRNVDGRKAIQLTDEYGLELR